MTGETLYFTQIPHRREHERCIAHEGPLQQAYSIRPIACALLADIESRGAYLP